MKAALKDWVKSQRAAELIRRSADSANLRHYIRATGGLKRRLLLGDGLSVQ